jgi:hypothetical protein
VRCARVVAPDRSHSRCRRSRPPPPVPQATHKKRKKVNGHFVVVFEFCFKRRMIHRLFIQDRLSSSQKSISTCKIVLKQNTQESCKGYCLLKTGRVFAETGSGLKSEIKNRNSWLFVFCLFVCFVFWFVCLSHHDGREPGRVGAAAPEALARPAEERPRQRHARHPLWQSTHHQS